MKSVHTPYIYVNMFSSSILIKHSDKLNENHFWLYSNNNKTLLTHKTKAQTLDKFVHQSAQNSLNTNIYILKFTQWRHIVLRNRTHPIQPVPSETAGYIRIIPNSTNSLLNYLCFQFNPCHHRHCWMHRAAQCSANLCGQTIAAWLMSCLVDHQTRLT